MVTQEIEISNNLGYLKCICWSMLLPTRKKQNGRRRRKQIVPANNEMTLYEVDVFLLMKLNSLL